MRPELRGVWEFDNVRLLTMIFLFLLRGCKYWKVSVRGKVCGKPKLRRNVEKKCEVKVAVRGV